MKVLSILFAFFFSVSVFGQITSFNLKNISHLSIKIIDNSNSFSERTIQKIKTEIKLKLMTLGIKVEESEEHGVLVISTNHIASSMAEHRALLQMFILETTSANRKTKTNTTAITYFDQKFFKSHDLGNDFYTLLMDDLIVKFVENILSSSN